MTEFNTLANWQFITLTQIDNENFIANNKITNVHVKINKNTFYLINLFNEKKTQAEILEELNDKEITLDKDGLYEITSELRRINLLVDGDTVSCQKSKKEDYLKLSITVFSVKKLNFISEVFKFLFLPKLRIFLLLICLLISSYVIANNSSFVYNKFSSIQLLSFSVYFLLIYLMVDVIHELGHTSALKFYNQSCGRMGLGFYLFIPVLFVDVSNSWNLPLKKRLVINFGGIYFELLFVTFLLIIFSFTHIYELFSIACVILIQCLFQFNPFIRTDGYWILSDVLNIPNLAQKSKIELSKIFKTTKVNINSPLLLYAIISYLVSFFIIISVLLSDSAVIYLISNFDKLFNDYQTNSYKIFNILMFLSSLLFYILLFKEIIKIILFAHKFMKKYLITVALILFLSFLGYGQNTLSGKIKNQDNMPIQFANIHETNSKIGVISNENGEFTINFSTIKLQDSIFVSCVGYKNKAISVLNSGKYIEIILQKNIITLKELTIFSLSDLDIVNEVIKNIPKNYPNQTTMNDTYFNYEVATNSQIIGYFDGFINIINPSYQKKTMDIRLTELKINLNKFKEINNFYHKSPKAVLSASFPEELPFVKNKNDYNFEIKTDVFNQMQVYIINFEPKNKHKKWQYGGSFVVHSKNYAILETSFDLLDNPLNKDVLIEIGFSKAKTITTYNSESYVIKYKFAENFYYNSFLKYTSFIDFFDAETKNKQDITLKAIFQTNNFTERPIKKDLTIGESFNLFSLKTKKGTDKSTKNRYLNSDLQQRIKTLKEQNSDLDN
jgi:putative peptide zinc metalloprotease protein